MSVFHSTPPPAPPPNGRGDVAYTTNGLGWVVCGSGGGGKVGGPVNPTPGPSPEWRGDVAYTVNGLGWVVGGIGGGGKVGVPFNPTPGPSPEWRGDVAYAAAGLGWVVGGIGGGGKVGVPVNPTLPQKIVVKILSVSTTKYGSPCLTCHLSSVKYKSTWQQPTGNSTLPTPN